MLLTIPQAGLLDKNIYENTQKKFDNLIKPVGSLARLEDITCLYMATCRQAPCLLPDKTMLLFLSDHGVAREGDFLYTVDDSFLLFEQISRTDGALNFLAQKMGAQVKAINLGLKKPSKINKDCIGAGTANILYSPAMREDDFIRAFAIGCQAAEAAAREGAEILGLGSIGAGAEISELILASVLLEKLPGELSRNIRHIAMAEEIISARGQYADIDNLDMASRFCGFEIPALLGALSQAAHMSVPVFFDGVTVLLAALLLAGKQPAVKDFLVPVATTTQAGQKELLDFLGISTMLDLKLSSGAGEGCILGFSLLDAGLKALNEMDSFGEQTVHGPLDNIKTGRNAI